MCEGDEGGGAGWPAGAARDDGCGVGAGEAAGAAVVHEAVLAAAVRHEVLRLLLHCAPVAHLLRDHLRFAHPISHPRSDCISSNVWRRPTGADLGTMQLLIESCLNLDGVQYGLEFRQPILAARQQTHQADKAFANINSNLFGIVELACIFRTLP